MTKRAVLYARVSSDDTRREGRNLAGQLDLCREYAQGHGYSIAAELHEDDHGASGAAFDLPQLNRVRDLAREKQFDVLIVREIDRLSRSLAKQLIVEEELKRAGVSIEYVLGEYPDTPEGGLMKNLRASIAEYERLKIHERMTRGRVLKVKGGSVMVHGRPPFGYHREEEGGKFVLVVKDSEAYIVKLIFEWYASEGFSLAEIKHRLDAMAALTCYDNRQIGRKLRERGEWSRGSIQKVLRNETYAGVWRYHRDHVHDDSLAVAVPAIIDAATWQRTQELLERNRSGKRRPPRFDYLLSGHLVCAHCGSRIVCNTADAEKGRAYYLCQAHRQYARPCDMTERFKALQVDGAAWKWLKSLLLNPEGIAEGLEEQREKRDAENAPLRQRLSIIEDLLANDRAQLARLLDLYLSGDFPKDVLTERKSRLDATIRALERERESVQTHLSNNSLSAKQVQALSDFAREVAEGLAEADTDFAARRQVIEKMGVEGRLALENGRRVLYLACLSDHKRVDIVNETGDEERARGATLVCRRLTAPASMVNPDLVS